MKNLLLFLTLIFLSLSNLFAQSDIRMRAEYGSENQDLMSILQFEEINSEKLIFTGNDLKNKDFQISLKKFVNGNSDKEEIVFDSKESEYFKIKSNKFIFRFLSKITFDSKAKLEFQFNGFSKAVSYEVEKTNGDFRRKFALKDFLGDKPDISIPLNKNIYILAFMMPYVRKDGSASYCEVAQSEVKPEELGKKFNIPTYFLIDIKFQ